KGVANNIVLELTKNSASPLLHTPENLANSRRTGINLTRLVKQCAKWRVLCVDPEHLCANEWREITEGRFFAPAFSSLSRTNISKTTRLALAS
ncbi:hypothetical protein C8F04DRAFT_1117961, partial [Mycena alexandri]